MYSRITMNLVGASKRYETLNGRQYLVVPAVMLTEGVHKGSEGPMLYNREELSKNPVSHNHKPIVVNHPMADGQPISACDPSIIESQGVGMTFSTNYDGRLKTEAWLDEPKLKQVDSRVLDAINANQMVEVSTGIFHDREVKDGEWNGEKYNGIVRNIQLDHLAILPDEKGACSIEDGAGLLRNADGTELSYDDIREQIRALLRKSPGDYTYVSDLYPKFAIYESGDKCYKIGYKVRAGKVSIDGEPEEVRKMTKYVTANGTIIFNDSGDQQGHAHSPPPVVADQLSQVMQHQQMQTALAEFYGGGNQVDPWGGWVVDIFAGYVVWSKDGKLFRLPYTYSADKISFTGEPLEVERLSEYRPRPQVPNTNRETPMPQVVQKPTQNTIMPASSLGKGDGEARTTDGGARANMVNKAIGSGRFGETDRAFLEGLSDELLGKVAGDAVRGAEQEIVPYSYSGIGDRSNVHNAVQGNQPISTKDYIEQAPPEIREVLVNAMSAHAEEKNRLIKTITANKNNRFNEKWLVSQKIDLLRGLAAVAGPSQGQPPRRATANYSGQAEVPMLIEDPQLTDNSGDDILTEGLPQPILNWDEERRAS